MNSGTHDRRIFVVAPAFNEEEAITKFIDAVAEMAPQLGGFTSEPVELILVDDGSRDLTFQVIRLIVQTERRLNVSCVRLSRNFGHQSAIYAGLEQAFSKAEPSSLFVLMDSDLQHPVDLIPGIVERLAQGVDHVQMVRQDVLADGWFKTLTSRWFYRIFRWLSEVDLPPGGSDFRGLSQRFVKAFFQLGERGRFNRAIFCWLGFDSVQVPYSPLKRTYGVSKYSLSKMLMLATNGISYFSSRPLLYLLGSIVGLSFASCALYLVYEATMFFRGHQYVVGWPTIIFLITFWGGVLAVGQFLLGLYLSRVFDEVKHRPVHIVREIAERS